MEKQASLIKAFRILEALARNRRMGVSDITAETGYPAPTVHRILSTLSEMGYVRQGSSDRRYHLGLNLLRLTASLSDSLDIAAVARPIMRRLMAETGETINLVVFEDYEAVYVEQVSNTSSMLRMFTKVGARVPLYSSGVGKAWLALMERKQLADYLGRVKRAAFTAHTLVEEADLLAELADIRERGYARDEEEMENGVACVAAAVFHGSRVVGGLSVSGPSSRINDAAAPGLGRLVIREAEEISRQLSELGSAMFA